MSSRRSIVVIGDWDVLCLIDGPDLASIGTGVLSEIQALSELVHRVSPDTLVVVDGVCSVGCEEIRFDDWGIDVVISATQK